jgi:hypothetical protein
MRPELVDKIRVNCQIADQGVVIGESKDFLFALLTDQTVRTGVVGI